MKIPILVASILFGMTVFSIGYDIYVIKYDHLYPYYFRTLAGQESMVASLGVLRTIFAPVLGFAGAGGVLFLAFLIFIGISSILESTFSKLKKTVTAKPNNGQLASDALKDKKQTFTLSYISSRVVLSCAAILLGFGSMGLIDSHGPNLDEPTASSANNVTSYHELFGNYLLSIFGLENPTSVNASIVETNINHKLGTIEWNLSKNDTILKEFYRLSASEKTTSKNVAYVENRQKLIYSHWVMLPGRLQAHSGDNVRYIINRTVTWDVNENGAEWVRTAIDGSRTVIRNVRVPIYHFELIDLDRNLYTEMQIRGYYEALDIAIQNLSRTDISDEELKSWEVENATYNENSYFEWLGFI